MKRLLKRCVLVLAICFLAIALYSVHIANEFSRPALRAVGDAPQGTEAVTIDSESGSEIAGWLTHVESPRGCALLVHGIQADRRQMSARAAFLNTLGFHTLAIDLQAHGESHGTRITMGHLEARDAEAGVALLRARFPELPVIVLGRSLGAAALLLADYDEPPNLFIVESVFRDIRTAVRNRMQRQLGFPGRAFASLLLAQFSLRMGVNPSDLSPREAVAQMRVPILFISGADDKLARPAEAMELLQSANGPSDLWLVPGAAHGDYMKHAETEYRERVRAFVEVHLD